MLHCVCYAVSCPKPFVQRVVCLTQTELFLNALAQKAHKGKPKKNVSLWHP